MNVSFRENKQEQFSTCFGAILSFFIIVIVLIHSKNKFEVMVNYEDYRYQEITEPLRGSSMIYNGNKETDFPFGAF